MYNDRTKHCAIPTYHLPASAYIKSDDPDQPAFFYDPIINPIPAFISEKSHSCVVSEISYTHVQDVDLEEEFVLPEGVLPLLAGAPLFTGCLVTLS
ncbi:hypothetical protein BLSTO_06559 [Blastocystis sp. subtype 1]